MKPDQNTIDTLKAEHGDGLTLLDSDSDVSVIVKPVEMGVYRLFKKQASGDDTKAMAGENLLYAVLVWPKRDEFQKAIRGKPFLIEHFTSEVVKAAGSKAEVVAKKL
jgi:hypothetical protein